MQIVDNAIYDRISAEWWSDDSFMALLRNARTNLTHPVRLYADLAVQAARGGDELYTSSLQLLADALDTEQRKRLTDARDATLKELHEERDGVKHLLGK